MSGYKAHISFGWIIAIYLVTGLALSLGAFYVLGSHQFSDNYSHALMVLKATRSYSLRHIAHLNIYILLAVAALICFASLFASHRISGPVYRMGKSADAVAEGDFSGRVRVRRKDYLQDTVRDMDLTFEVLRGRLTEVRRIAEDVRSTASDMAARETELMSDADELSWLTRKLEDEQYKLDERLSFFHTS